MPYWYIDDLDQKTIRITDATVLLYDIPKFDIRMTVEEPILNLYWSDTQYGDGGFRRLLKIDYRDVVDGYASYGYIDNPSSAANLMATIEAMIVSGWTDISGGGGGDILTAKAELLSHDGVSDTILPGGTNEYILSRDDSTQTGLKWIAKTAITSTNVVGPSSSVNNNIAVFDGITGKLIKDSGVNTAGLNVFNYITFN